MRVENQLIEQYWTAVYANDENALCNIVDPEIQCITEHNGVQTTLKNSDEVLKQIKKINEKIKSINFIKRSYDFSDDSKVTVRFKQELTLKESGTFQSEGTQTWTTKTDAHGKRVLASVHIQEKSTFNSSNAEEQKEQVNKIPNMVLSTIS